MVEQWEDVTGTPPPTLHGGQRWLPPCKRLHAPAIGSEVSAYGARLFVGAGGEWESPKYTRQPFSGFGCRGECDDCCQSTHTTTAGAAGAMALPGVKELTDYLGLEVSIAFETDGCLTSFALEMKANIIQWIPGLGQIAAAVNKTKLGKVKAGLVGSGKASVCKSKPRVVGDANSTNIVFRDGEVALGIFVTLGIGAGT